jgi:Protease inhibitor Inh
MARWLFVVVLLLIGAADRAGAQAPAPEAVPAPAPSDAVKAMIGAWEFTNAPRDKLCTVRFRTEPVAHGMKLDFDSSCSGLFAFVAEVAGWTIADNDFLRLIDADGRPVLEFSEVENGVYEAPKPGEGILFIQKPTAAPAQRTTADLSGEWSVARANGRPICRLTLTNDAAGDDFAVRVTPPCDPLVTRFGPVAWRIDNDQLLLKSARGQVWRFEEGEAQTWRRVPASANPVTMTKK